MLEEKVERSLSIPPDTPVILRNSNGSVHAAFAGPGRTPSAVARRMVEPDLPHTKYIQVEVDPGPPFVVRSSYTLSRVKASVDLEVMLPGDARSLEIETLNGNIVVRGLDCPLRASTCNGFIRCQGPAGPLALHTRNGVIEVLGGASPASVGTINGDILVEVASVPPEGAVISTVLGSIEVGVCAGLSADIEAETGRGTVIVDGVALSSAVSGAGRLAGRIGAGGPVLKITTRRGDISIRNSDGGAGS